MSSGMFEPEDTPEQQAALARLETLLALIEGWVDAVVAEAVGERLPGAGALQETMRRRRASGGPAEQAFATVVGLELRPRRLRAAAELWQRLGEQLGSTGRDAVWGHPDLIPSADDLDDPEAFVRRAAGSGDADDPIAELERQMKADEEREGRPGGAGADRPVRAGRDRVRTDVSGGLRVGAAAVDPVVLAVDGGQAERGGRVEALQVADRPLGARVAVHPRPEPGVVAGLEQVRQLVDQHVVDDPPGCVAQALAQPDRAVGRACRTPTASASAAPSGSRPAGHGPSR